jgi:hypothetical protein
VPTANDSAPAAEISPPPSVRPRLKRKIILWTLFFLFLAAVLWAATSSNPFAQGLQELAGKKHDQTILDTPFSLSPHNFRYYKFSLPQDSTNVAIVGDFQASPEKSNRSSDKDAGRVADAGIEVFVLTESAFAIWQRGYAASSVYESGKVSEGKLQQDLPAGAGVYYLVFSNKSDPKMSKNVNASILLRYKSWLPEWFRRIKE